MITILFCLSGVVAVLVFGIALLKRIPNRIYAPVAKVPAQPWSAEELSSIPFFQSPSNNDSETLAGKTFQGLTKIQLEEFLDWLENQANPISYEIECENGLFTIRFAPYD